MPLRLSIFEDSRDYRESLVQLFKYTDDVEVAGAHPDCAQLRDAVLEEQPNVILMDVDMPGISGIEATEIVKTIAPQTQVIILTVSEEEQRIFRALQNGATGYLLKKTSPEEIVDSVRAVHLGGSPMSPAIARKVLQFFRPKPSDTTFHPTNTHPTTTALSTPQSTASHISETRTSSKENTPPTSSDLSPREREILEGLVDGLSYKLIAAKYYISPDTVKNHIQTIYRKLHVNSKGEAISMALRQGIVG